MPGAERVEKGLANGFGENNCFLNVVIQSLWHLSPFRDKFRTWETHTHDNTGITTEKCVHCSLKQIMVHYENSESPYIPPTSLRKTLHNLFESESRFQMGDLDDAAEALEAVLENLHSVVNTDDGEENCISHLVFGIDLMKQVTCSYCHSTSEPETSRHFIEYVYVSTLREKHIENPSAAFETLLKTSGQEIKSCPQDEGPCKDKKSLVSRYLLNLPEVFAVGLVWPTTNPSPPEIMNLLMLIRSVIDIRNIFTTVQTEPSPYKFRGMICFYGKHYDSYFYSDFRRQWLVFDDATVKCVGDTWEHVLNRCRLGHFHPSVLFYERVPGTYKPAKPVFSKPKPKSYSSIDLLTPPSPSPSPPITKPILTPEPVYSNNSPNNSLNDLLTPQQNSNTPNEFVNNTVHTTVIQHPQPKNTSNINGDLLDILTPSSNYNDTNHSHNSYDSWNSNLSPLLTTDQITSSPNNISVGSINNNYDINNQNNNYNQNISNHKIEYPFPDTITNKRFLLGGIPQGYKLIYKPSL